jgi:hypothetical protein
LNNKVMRTIKELPSEKTVCGCSKDRPATPPASRQELSDRPWVSGFIAAPAGDIPIVSTRLSLGDKLSALKVRWGIGRMKYSVPPGLYTVGRPGPRSPVLVTSNYKLTLDSLRRRLSGQEVWIMVLDTRGINVWCAAGKGTFGTEEVINRIAAVHLSEIVSHRKVILPQLGAPGVAAHEVQKRSGFRVVFGPVRAEDIPAFLSTGLRASSNMRRVHFRFQDRLKLVSMELVGSLKYLLAMAALLALVELLAYRRVAAWDFLPYLGAVIIGSSLVPLLLPWIPGRAFSLKGALSGLVWALFLIAGGRVGWLPAVGWKLGVVYLLFLPAISAFLAMGFTGSSTFTSLSGVIREMKTAVPLMGASVLLGVVFYAVSFFI